MRGIPPQLFRRLAICYSGLRFACGSASAEALGVRPSQETLRCGVCALRVGPPLPRRRALAPCRSAASQEPPGAARDRQGQPGATRSHQEQPGARIAARSRQEPPGCARSGQEQPEVPICSIRRTVVCFGRWRSWVPLSWPVVRHRWRVRGVGFRVLSFYYVAEERRRSRVQPSCAGGRA